MIDTTPRGITCLIVATLFFAIQDTLTKTLIQTMSAWQIVSIRFFFFALFAMVWASRSIGLRRAFRSANPVLQILRGILIVTEIALFAHVVGRMGLAEMHAIFACFPLLITALSVPFLGEKVGWRRWLAVCIGFIGTLIIIRPGTGVFDVYSVLALVTALMFSIYNILTKKLSGSDPFETSLLYFGVAGFLCSLLFVPFVWQPLQPGDANMLLWISATAIIGHFLLIKALELAPAVVLQPFMYFVLVWAIIMGYVVFGELLDAVSLFGAAIVVGSGIFIARREYKLGVSGGSDGVK